MFVLTNVGFQAFHAEDQLIPIIYLVHFLGIGANLLISVILSYGDTSILCVCGGGGGGGGEERGSNRTDGSCSLYQLPGGGGGG